MTALLWILFLVVAVLGRIILQYTITGDHGIRLAQASSPLIIRLSSFLLLLSFLFISLLVFQDTYNKLSQELFFNGSVVFYLGMMLSILGILLTVISQYQMGASWRVGIDENEKTELITQGIYSYIRNPIYSGVIVFCIGLLLMIPSIYMFIACVLTVISIEIHIRFGEEPYLRKMHGKQFDKYVKNTGCYFPKFIK